jgi:basic membrane lipoprotein Med (substrate-binding protein (PBP1-ABC) superfamily)
MVHTVRRLKTLPIVVAIVLLTAACGVDEKPSVPQFTVRLLTARSVSGHWDRAVDRGLDRLGAELGAEVERIAADHPTEHRDLLVEAGRAGINLVFCVGVFPETTLYSVANSYPATVFVLLPGGVNAENVAGIRFMPEEAGYLAGAIAGALAPDGALGLLHGGGQPWLEPLEEGYVAGFGSRRRKMEVTVAEGADGVWELSSAGVLVSLYSADRAEPEVLAAAHDAGLLLVATNTDLLESESGMVVAAVSVDVAEAMLRVAREVRDGTFAGRVFAFDLGSGVLDVVINPDLAPDSLAIAGEALEEARAEITAGLVEFDELGL